MGDCVGIDNQQFVEIFEKELIKFKEQIEEGKKKGRIELNPATVQLFNGLTNPSYGTMDTLQNEFEQIKKILIKGNEEELESPEIVRTEIPILPLFFLQYCAIEELQFEKLRYQLEVNKYNIPEVLITLSLDKVKIDNLREFLVSGGSVVWKKLQYLTISNAGIRSIDDGLFIEDFFPELLLLDLSNNEIEVLENIGERPLEHLKLNNNKIASIRLTVVGSISKLELNDNKISNILPLSNFYGLERLWLANNQIKYFTDFEKVFSKMYNLKDVMLNGNSICADDSFKMNISTVMPIFQTGITADITLNGVKMSKDEQKKVLMRLSSRSYYMLDEILDDNEIQKEKEIGKKQQKEIEMEKRRLREMKANFKAEKEVRLKKELAICNFYRNFLFMSRKTGFEQMEERQRGENYLNYVKTLIEQSRVKQTLSPLEIESDESDEESDIEIQAIEENADGTIPVFRIDVSKWVEQTYFDKQILSMVNVMENAKQRSFNFKLFFEEETNRMRKITIEIPLSRKEFPGYFKDVINHFDKHKANFQQNDRMKEERWKRVLKKKEEENNLLEEEKKKVNTFKGVRREMNDGHLAQRIDDAQVRVKNQFIKCEGNASRLLIQSDKNTQRAVLKELEKPKEKGNLTHHRSELFNKPENVSSIERMIDKQIKEMKGKENKERVFSIGLCNDNGTEEAKKNILLLINQCKPFDIKVERQKIQNSRGTAHRPSALIGYSMLLKDQKDPVYATRAKVEQEEPNFFGEKKEKEEIDVTMVKMFGVEFPLKAMRKRRGTMRENRTIPRRTIASKFRIGRQAQSAFMKVTKPTRSRNELVDSVLARVSENKEGSESKTRIVVGRQRRPTEESIKPIIDDGTLPPVPPKPRSGLMNESAPSSEDNEDSPVKRRPVIGMTQRGQRNSPLAIPPEQTLQNVPAVPSKPSRLLGTVQPEEVSDIPPPVPSKPPRLEQNELPKEPEEDKKAIKEEDKKAIKEEDKKAIKEEEKRQKEEEKRQKEEEKRQKEEEKRQKEEEKRLREEEKRQKEEEEKRQKEEEKRLREEEKLKKKLEEDERKKMKEEMKKAQKEEERLKKEEKKQEKKNKKTEDTNNNESEEEVIPGVPSQNFPTPAAVANPVDGEFSSKGIVTPKEISLDLNQLDFVKQPVHQDEEDDEIPTQPITRKMGNLLGTRQPKKETLPQEEPEGDEEPIEPAFAHRGFQMGVRKPHAVQQIPVNISSYTPDQYQEETPEATTTTEETNEAPPVPAPRRGLMLGRRSINETSSEEPSQEELPPPVPEKTYIEQEEICEAPPVPAPRRGLTLGRKSVTNIPSEEHQQEQPIPPPPPERVYKETQQTNTEQEDELNEVPPVPAPRNGLAHVRQSTVEEQPKQKEPSPQPSVTEPPVPAAVANPIDNASTGPIITPKEISLDLNQLDFVKQPVHQDEEDDEIPTQPITRKMGNLLGTRQPKKEVRQQEEPEGDEEPIEPAFAHRGFQMGVRKPHAVQQIPVNISSYTPDQYQEETPEATTTTEETNEAPPVPAPRRGLMLGRRSVQQTTSSEEGFVDNQYSNASEQTDEQEEICEAPPVPAPRRGLVLGRRSSSISSEEHSFGQGYEKTNEEQYPNTEGAIQQEVPEQFQEEQPAEQNQQPQRQGRISIGRKGGRNSFSRRGRG
ncbi:hypothetical protein EDI_229990 [Entamoeba dispar SAW760]|uniref:Uncharacterized protein n=1 Tax=Entamoeba dispar (strain ATCC PRA-260 / SAW760) TaxID=370354 RepID=B0EQJ3_ENTDS|nr:uncharacterized protein EDI_229990 [Entamoeba dispar SAW760]EDR23192.1 hypothetical protein EDI_229990 [Entamoeba dispar SAW760]|eukprot:EDR23192.1 hypothetical protein EDI_229990 [Entamoeba dispar SAW760]